MLTYADLDEKEQQPGFRGVPDLENGQAPGGGVNETTRMHYPGSSDSTPGIEMNEFGSVASGGGNVRASESSRMPLRR